MRDSLFKRLPDSDGPLGTSERRALYDAYYESLSSVDYSGSGDLLRYFARDFFHDSPMTHVRFESGAQSFGFCAASLNVEVGEHKCLSPGPEFDVLFERVVGLDWRCDAKNQRIYIESEIDGRPDLIAEAQGEHGGRFHSIAINAYRESIELVFGSVRVSPLDPARWCEIEADPGLHVLGLFEA